MTATAVRSLALTLLGIAVAASAGHAQATDADEPPPRSVLDGVYTEEQAERGRATFQARCAACHGTIEFTISSFMRSWAGARAYDLFRLISTTMPNDNPGGLEPQRYANLLSYILELNGLPPGEEELPAEEDALKRIRIERPPEGDQGETR